MAETAKRAKDIFLAALDLAAPDRAAYLAQACGGDEVLRRHIEALLQAEAAPGSFLEKPAAALEATAAAPSPAAAGAGTSTPPRRKGHERVTWNDNIAVSPDRLDDVLAIDADQPCGRRPRVSPARQSPLLCRPVGGASR